MDGIDRAFQRWSELMRGIVFFTYLVAGASLIGCGSGDGAEDCIDDCIQSCCAGQTVCTCQGQCFQRCGID